MQKCPFAIYMGSVTGIPEICMDINMKEKIQYIYIPDGNIEIYHKVILSKKDYQLPNQNSIISDDILFGSKINNNLIVQVIKDNFNPLLEKQNILLLDLNYNIIEQISYIGLEKFEHFQILQDLITDANCLSAFKMILKLLIKYMQYKDIIILKEIYEECEKQNVKLNTLIFKKLNHYFSQLEPKTELGKEILSLFEVDNLLNEKKSDSLYDIRNSIDRHVQSLKQYKKNAVCSIEKDQKKKNLIVFHMESISNEIFINHRYEFRGIEKLMNQSLNFGKFYSTATSSAMSISDFIHGNDFEMDRFTNFHDMIVDARYGKGLYKILEEKGYQILGIGYNFFPKTEEVNSHGIWDSKHEKYRWVDDFSFFLEQLIDFIIQNKEKPFAIHVWNLMPHVGQKCKETQDAANFYDRINMAYESLNMTIERIYVILNQYNLLDKTVISGYGDHGDDKWTRSINAGFTHTIEPYHNIINTPAFIYDTRLNPQYSDELVSLVDLKNTLLYLTGNEISKEFDFAGKNIFKEENQYVFSKRLFVNQQYYEEIKALPMMKLYNFSDKEFRNQSYAIIGKKYTLIVSLNGCEMFMNQLDPFSYNNVLNFYHMDEDGNLISFENRGAWRGHYRTIMMQDEQVYDMVSGFYEMSNLLKQRIRYHEKLVGKELKNTFYEENFKKIRNRGFIE